jgi:hypothetical protein
MITWPSPSIRIQPRSSVRRLAITLSRRMCDPCRTTPRRLYHPLPTLRQPLRNPTTSAGCRLCLGAQTSTTTLDLLLKLNRTWTTRTALQHVKLPTPPFPSLSQPFRNPIKDRVAQGRRQLLSDRQAVLQVPLDTQRRISSPKWSIPLSRLSLTPAQ